MVRDRIFALLSTEQEEEAEAVGRRRRENAIKHSIEPGSNLSASLARELAIDIAGAKGEKAGSVWLGLKWNQFLDKFKGKADLGKTVEVKAVRKNSHRLMLTIGSVYPARPYVLVSAEIAPLYEILGWCWGRVAGPWTIQEPQKGRPCYVIPRENLAHPNELKHLVEEGRVR